MKLKLEGVMYYPISWTVPVDHTIMLQHEHSIYPPRKVVFPLKICLVAFTSGDDSLFACVRYPWLDWLFILWKNLIIRIPTVPLPFLGNRIISKQSYVGCSFFFLKQGLKQNIYALCSIAAFLSHLYITKNQNCRELQNMPWSRAHHSINWDTELTWMKSQNHWHTAWHDTHWLILQ